MTRYCSQCKKAHKACICSLIVPLSSDIELIILQHPTEVNKPVGTARILTLSLVNAICFVGEDFTHHDELNRLFAEPNCMHYVLYPCEGSVCISDMPLHHIAQPAQKQPVQKTRVILLDGTWKKAYKIWQLSQNLHGLPCLHLPEELSGHYQIRKAPRAGCLSTVEAGYHVLSQWQPQLDFQPLLTSFAHMIRFQLDHMPPEVQQRYMDIDQQ